MDVTQADAYNTLRGYTDWQGAPATKAAMLVRAQDYISATYKLRSDLTPAELTRVDSALCLLARDMLTGTSVSIRATAAITKQSDEMTGVGKSSVEYADAPADLYPYITVLLSDLVIDKSAPAYAIGKLVR